MKNLLKIALWGAVLAIAGCKKHENVNNPTTIKSTVLSAEKQEAKQKLERLAAVFGEAMKDDAIRTAFNNQVSLKLKTTGYDEALTLAEMMGEPQSNGSYNGVSKAFAAKMQTKLAGILGAKPDNHGLLLEVSSAGKGTAIGKTAYVQAHPSAELQTEIGGMPTEVYVPYSENFVSREGQSFTVTSNPMNNAEENIGVKWDPVKQAWQEVTVDDRYAQQNQTYIVTVDDGYRNVAEMINDQKGKEVPKEIILNDVSYQLQEPNALPMPIYQGELRLPDETVNGAIYSKKKLNSTGAPAPDPSKSEVSTLFVKDIRCTQVPSIFEGKTEFAFAVPVAQDGMTLVNGNPNLQTAKLLTYAMKQIKRKRVKEMSKDENISEPVGWTITNWKSGQADLSFIIYEQDRPFLGSTDAGNVAVDALVDVAGIFFKGGKFTKLADGPIRKVLKALVPGGKAHLKHSYFLNRDEVYNNQNVPNYAMWPHLLNGKRPYGSNEWMLNYMFQ